MSRLGRRFLVLALFLANLLPLSAQAQENIGADRNAVEAACVAFNLPGSATSSGYAECVGQSYRYLLEQYTNLGGDIAGFQWIPHQGVAMIRNNVILVAFKCDNEAIDFFRSTFRETGTRIPMGMEIDISTISDFNVLNPQLGVVWSNLPEDAGLTADTGEFDRHPSYGAIIRFPQKLEAEKLYYVLFFPDVSSGYSSVISREGNVRLVLQLSINTSVMDQIIWNYDLDRTSPLDLSDDVWGSLSDYFVMKSNPSNLMTVLYPQGEDICWHDKSINDDVGCKAGLPFSSSVASESESLSPEHLPSDAVVSAEVINSTGEASSLAPHLNISRQGEDHELLPGKHVLFVGETLDFEVKARSEDNIADSLGGADRLTIDLDWEKTDDWKEIADFSAKRENLNGTEHVEKISWTVPDNGATRMRFRVHIDNGDATLITDWFEVRRRSVDGMISNILIPEGTSPYANSPFHIKAAARNIGTETPAADTHIAYYLDGRYLTDDEIRGFQLAPNVDWQEETHESFLTPATPGVHEVKVCFDYQGELPETNERNNCTKIKITVLPASPNLRIAAKSLKEGSTVKKGKIAHPSCTVKNSGNASPVGATVRVDYLFDGVVRASDTFKSYHMEPGETRTVEWGGAGTK